MEARELRATSSLITLTVLAGITGFITLIVLKNLLQVPSSKGCNSQCPRPSTMTGLSSPAGQCWRCR